MRKKANGNFWRLQFPSPLLGGCCYIAADDDADGEDVDVDVDVDDDDDDDCDERDMVSHLAACSQILEGETWEHLRQDKCKRQSRKSAWQDSAEMCILEIHTDLKWIFRFIPKHSSYESQGYQEEGDGEDEAGAPVQEAQVVEVGERTYLNHTSFTKKASEMNV